MKSYLWLSIVIALQMSAKFSFGMDFNSWFENKTMRVDYFHSGTATEEHFSMDRVLSDGIWAGSNTVLADDLKFGLYFFEVFDQSTGTLLYSRGYASVFGEWQSTPEAVNWGTFHESIRFPWPLKPVKIVISKRNEKMLFASIWDTVIDPAARWVNKGDLQSPYKSWSFIDNGAPNQKVDIVILGDGYTQAEMEKFHKDVERLAGELFKVEPFKSRKSDFNVRGVETPSAVSGVSRPHAGIFKRTPLSTHYSSFDSERYVLSYDNRTIRDVAASVPYDYMFILVNERTYGGGGIFNLYSTVASDNKFSDYIFVHEFGHSFAGLADEYYSSAVAYEIPAITTEPWEANITAFLDKSKVKWADLLTAGTPIPTPWDKENFDKFSYEIQKERVVIRSTQQPEEVMEALFERERKHETEMLDNMKYSKCVGLFEGAGYNQFGMYRGYPDCIMFTRNRNDFCPVCQSAIQKVIEQYVK